MWGMSSACVLTGKWNYSMIYTINSLDFLDHIDFSIHLENYLFKQTTINQDNDSHFTNSIPPSSLDKI